MRQVAQLSAAQLDRPVTVRHVPWPLLDPVLRGLGALDARAADSRARFAYFRTGRFVADPTRQAQTLGPVPTAEDAVVGWLTPQPASQPLAVR